nr:hypothetical protein [Achromobacter sp. DMS1]
MRRLAREGSALSALGPSLLAGIAAASSCPTCWTPGRACRAWAPMPAAWPPPRWPRA